MYERVLDSTVRRGRINGKHFLIFALMVIFIWLCASSNEYILPSPLLRNVNPSSLFRFNATLGDVLTGRSQDVVDKSFALYCYNSNSTSRAIEILDEDQVPVDKSIFFIETYCHDDVFELTPRQLCSIESAARLNPNSVVYILVPSIVHRLSSSFRMTKLLLSYENVQIRHLDMTRYLEGSPLSTWNWESHLKTSLWPQAHASDVLRYLTLWKFGGTYFDMDVILMRPLNGTNFAGAESDEDVGSAVISVNRGHPLNKLALVDLSNNFHGDDWPTNGPGVIKRSLWALCGVEKTYEMNLENCGTFQVLPPEQIYPIHWSEWESFFSNEAQTARDIMETVKNSTTVHLWNNLSRARKAETGSGQPYVQIASKMCPETYSTLETTF